MEDKPHVPSSSFAKEIALFPGGEVINKCIQCGLCTASCSVASVSEKYRPRQLIQKILIGKKNDVINSDLPWLCMTCRMCEERCQEDVSPAEIFKAVRQLAVREGYIPPAFLAAAETVLRDGWMLKDSYSDFIEEDREDLGLDINLAWDEKFVRKVREKYLKGEIPG